MPPDLAWRSDLMLDPLKESERGQGRTLALQSEEGRGKRKRAEDVPISSFGQRIIHLPFLGPCLKGPWPI